MAVYDDEQQKTDVSDDELRKITGVSPDEEDTMEREAYNGAADEISEKGGLSGSALNEAEDSGDKPADTAADKAEKGLFDDDQIGKGFKDEGAGGGLVAGLKNKLGGKISSQQKIVAGGAGLIIGGVMLIFSVLSGFFGMVHFAQLLRGFHFVVNEQIMNDRASRYLLFAATGAAERSRLGAIGNEAADRLENKIERDTGLKKVLGPSPAKRFIGFEVIDESKADNILRDLEREGYNTDDRYTNGNRLVRVEGRDIQGGKRRSLVRAVVTGADINNVPGSMSSRLLIKRGGVNFRPYKNLRREAGQSLSDFREKRRKARSEERKRGVDTPDGRLTGTEEDTDGDGRTDSGEGTSESADGGNDVADQSRDVAPDGRGTLARNLIRGASGLASVASALCTVREVGSLVDEYQYENIVLPMLRMGGEVITGGNQIMSGSDINTEEIGVQGEDMTDEEGKSFIAARSMQYELGKEPTGPDIPPGARPSRVGEKLFFFNIVEDIPFLGSICGVANSISAIPIIGDAINLGSDAIEGGINAALSPTGYSIEEFMESVVAFFAGDVVNTYAQGPELGNIANYGARLAANDQAIASGGRLLTESEMNIRDQTNAIALKEEFSKQSFFARVLDIRDVRSVAGRASLEMPQTPSGAVAKIFSSPQGVFAGIFRPISAQTQSEYEYGFDEYGFSIAEQEDERFSDPYENESSLDAFIAGNLAVQQACEPNWPREEWKAKCDVPYSDMSEFNNGDSTYGSGEGDGSDAVGSDHKANGRQCFGMEIGANGDLINHETVKYFELDPACSSSDANWLRYRFYVTDAITAHTLACYEGREQSCSQLGFGSSPTGNSSPTSVPGSGYRGLDTSAMQCPAGSTDLGVKQVPTGEGLPAGIPQHSIRLCGLPEIPSGVNVAIAANIMGLIADAKNDGVNLSGGSFRTSESQISLRRAYCGTSNFAIYEMSPSSCSPPTARPGQSMHEQALAIDFSNCSSRSSSCYIWLAENAANYGLQNLPSEPWHWSTTGG